MKKKAKLESKNKVTEWESIYNKFTPAIHRIIFSITNDRIIAEEIFMETALLLRQSETLSKISYSFCTRLIKQTYSRTINQLRRYGINPQMQHLPEETKLIHLLCAENNFNLAEDEAREKLHVDFLKLHNQLYYSQHL